MKLACERVDCNGISRRVALEALRRAPIMANAADRALEELATVGVCRSYGPWQWIVEPEDDRATVCVLVGGGARLVHRPEADREIVSASFGPGDIFGLWLIAPAARLSGGLEAGIDGAVVYRIPPSRFRTFLDAHPAVARRVLEVVCGEATALNRQVGTLARGSLRARVASLICDRTAPGPRCIVRLTQQEIASHIGTRREEVNRVIRELRHRGLIACPSRGCIVVLDLGRLAVEARH